MTVMKQLTAVARDRVGKGAARHTRRQGQLPAVIYGAGAPPQAIALDAKDMRKLIYAGHFLTTLFEIDVAGTKTKVIPRDYQLDPVRDFPVHIDFLRLAEGQSIKVEVPVHVIGQSESPGVKAGGAVQIVEHSVELLVPMDDIPEFIEVSVAHLDVGATVHLSDIVLPKGAKPALQDDVTLVSLVAPKASKEEATPAAAPAKK
jgi:large subunit ribosomal protein L25